MQDMINIRRWHSYLGLLIAPSVLFFALTGAAQLFGLHEAHGNYKPAALIEKLSSVHKDQEYALGHHGPPSPDATASEPDAGAVRSAAVQADDDKPDLRKALLKAYFLIVALALAVSTGFGIWMGLTQIRRRSLAWTLLLTGAVVPVMLLLI
jgi:hypothetical protein